MPHRDRAGQGATKIDTPTTYVLALSCDELRALWANDEYLGLMDKTSKGRDIVGKRFEEFAPLTTTAGFTERIHRVALTGEPYTIASHEIADVARGATHWVWSVYRIPAGAEPIVLVVGYTYGKPLS